jgi:hypothetical protein
MVSDFPRRAMSAFCPHCNERLILEDLTIKKFHAAREVNTCGDMTVERKGHVVASSIHVANLTVRGKLEGQVVARNRITISKTGSLRGEIEAPCLSVEMGANINCFINIHPRSEPHRTDRTVPPPLPRQS